jgi:hypothetical protein
MNAGLPGTGLGGVFYLLSALWMPVHSLLRRGGAGERAPSRLIVRQFAIAVAMIGMLFLTGYTLGLMFQLGGGGAAHSAAEVTTAASVVPPEFVRTALLLLTVGVLALLLLVVEVAGAVLRRRRPMPARPPRFPATSVDLEEYGAS